VKFHPRIVVRTWQSELTNLHPDRHIDGWPTDTVTRDSDPDRNDGLPRRASQLRIG